MAIVANVLRRLMILGVVVCGMFGTAASTATMVRDGYGNIDWDFYQRHPGIPGLAAYPGGYSDEKPVRVQVVRRGVMNKLPIYPGAPAAAAAAARRAVNYEALPSYRHSPPVQSVNFERLPLYDDWESMRRDPFPAEQPRMSGWDKLKHAVNNGLRSSQNVVKSMQETVALNDILRKLTTLDAKLTNLQYDLTRLETEINTPSNPAKNFLGLGGVTQPVAVSIPDEVNIQTDYVNYEEDYNSESQGSGRKDLFDRSSKYGQVSDNCEDDGDEEEDEAENDTDAVDNFGEQTYLRTRKPTKRPKQTRRPKTTRRPTTTPQIPVFKRKIIQLDDNDVEDDQFATENVKIPGRKSVQPYPYGKRNFNYWPNWTPTTKTSTSTIRPEVKSTMSTTTLKTKLKAISTTPKIVSESNSDLSEIVKQLDNEEATVGVTTESEFAIDAAKLPTIKP